MWNILAYERESKKKKLLMLISLLVLNQEKLWDNVSTNV